MVTHKREPQSSHNVKKTVRGDAALAAVRLVASNEQRIGESTPDFGGSSSERLLDQLLDSLESESTVTGPSFTQKFRLLENAVSEREQRELNAPIRTLRDFNLRLGQMRKATKRGRFDSHLEVAARNLHKYVNDHRARQDCAYWKARTMLYKLNEVFQFDPQINRDAADDGLKIAEEIEELKRTWRQNPNLRSQSYRRLLREKVLFCCCRGDELKRRGDNADALILFEHLLRFVDDKLNAPDFPCFGTRAYLSYNLGTMLRIREAHKEAVKMFAQALDLYRQRASSRDPFDQDDFYFTTRRIAMCIGMGFGQVNLTRGYLNHAQHALTAARAMLARIPDSLVAHYIEMLYGTIKRCRAGTDHEGLAEAIRSLNNAYKAFERRKHIRFKAHAARELALAFNLFKDYRRAHIFLLTFEAFVIGEGDKTNEANVHVFRSRINRGEQKYQDALNEAQAAVKLAAECGDVLAHVDALIARGEAYLYLPDMEPMQQRYCSLARRDFEHAENMLKEIRGNNSSTGKPLNPKIAAVCALRIAQCCARDGHQLDAEVHFARWMALATTVEHTWIHELAREVRANIDTLKSNFVVSASEPGEWNRGEILARLNVWLAQTVVTYCRGDSKKAAKLMGVSPASVYNWMTSPPKLAKRARIKNQRQKR